MSTGLSAVGERPFFFGKIIYSRITGEAFWVMDLGSSADQVGRGGPRPYVSPLASVGRTRHPWGPSVRSPWSSSVKTKARRAARSGGS